MNEEKSSPPEWKKPYQIFPADPVWDESKDWCLEIGPGNGKFLLWLAEQNPDRLFIAIEIRNMRYQNIVEKVKSFLKPEARSQKLETDQENPASGFQPPASGFPHNLIAIHGDARYCLPYLFKKESLKEAFILFPDPWPKRRHHKHRLINTERTDQLHDMLKTGGCAWVATDHDNYSGHIQSVFPKEKWVFEEGQSLFSTYFETKWKKLGRKIHYFCFKKSA